MRKLKQLWELCAEHRVQTAVLLGLCGLALILLSGMFAGNRTMSAEQPAAERAVTDADYTREIEQKLTKLLSQMEGVGAATVMVTVSGTAEQIYAEEVSASQNDRGRQTQNAYVITKSGGNESALVAQTKYPQIAGVAVLCSGGDRVTVQEKVIRAVSTVLGIPSADIFVGRQAAAPIS